MESKVDKVLKRLIISKEKGVFSFDLIPYGGLRYAARINDLKKQGYSIISQAEKRNGAIGCRYFLV